MGSILVDRSNTASKFSASIWVMLANDARTSTKVWRISGPRLPQQYAPVVYGIIQAAITTAVATAIAPIS
jgi:hypothetical protein